MANTTINQNRYIVDEPLYQWDKNQVLYVRGLSLSVAPEVHFATDAMDRAIVRQASIDTAGVISAKVPNSLLQSSGTIYAYICKYDDDTFETLYKLDIPVKARKRPGDYTFTDDEEEIYSFNALENEISNLKSFYEAKYADVTIKLTNISPLVNKHETALSKKANASVILPTALFASGWSGMTYSFESDYPFNKYDLEIALDNTATLAELSAFNGAQIVGSANTNIVKAYGTVPTIDIPIVLKVVAK